MGSININRQASAVHFSSNQQKSQYTSKVKILATLGLKPCASESESTAANLCAKNPPPKKHTSDVCVLNADVKLRVWTLPQKSWLCRIELYPVSSQTLFSFKNFLLLADLYFFSSSFPSARCQNPGNCQYLFAVFAPLFVHSRNEWICPRVEKLS